MNVYWWYRVCPSVKRLVSEILYQFPQKLFPLTKTAHKVQCLGRRDH